jgi:ankyrin repeat protein
LLINKGADVNLFGPRKKTALHYAAEVDAAEIVESLVNKGVNVNARDEDGRTPLYVASASGKCNVIAALIKAKADPRIKDLCVAVVSV